MPPMNPSACAMPPSSLRPRLWSPSCAPRQTRCRPVNPCSSTIRRLASRQVVTLAAVRSLHLAQLYGAGLSAAKTDNRIATVDDYGTTQRWAKAFHAHPEGFDGIVYMSRYLGSHRSVVLFDRARDAIAFNPPRPLLHHPELAHLLDTYHVSLVPPGERRRRRRRAPPGDASPGNPQAAQATVIAQPFPKR